MCVPVYACGDSIRTKVVVTHSGERRMVSWLSSLIVRRRPLSDDSQKASSQRKTPSGLYCTPTQVYIIHLLLPPGQAFRGSLSMKERCIGIIALFTTAGIERKIELLMGKLML